MAIPQRPRVVLADDHPAVVEQLRGVLEPECEVVAVAADGVQLLAAVDQPHDVVVTDVSMPLMDGISAVRAILARNPSERVVVVTVHHGQGMAKAALAAGALAYVPKLVAGEELMAAVRNALRGERYVSPPV